VSLSFAPKNRCPFLEAGDSLIPSSVSKNIICRGGWSHHSPLKTSAFLEVPDGVTRPYKCIFKGDPIATVTANHLYERVKFWSIFEKKIKVLLQIVFVVVDFVKWS